MRSANRNKRLFWYCLYTGKTELTDEWGNNTGEFLPTYDGATPIRANVSPATGQSNTEQFGNLDNYDKVIVTTWINCPIDENTVLFIDKLPEFRTVTVGGNTTVTGDTGATADPVTVADQTDDTGTDNTTTLSMPLYDYVVRRVAKSLNQISIAVSKVKVS